MGLLKSKKLKKVEEQYLDALGEKKKLEIEVEQISLRIENMRADEKRKLDDAKAEFDRRVAQKEHEFDLKTKELKSEHEIKLKEAVSLAKLDGQQKIAQAQVEFDNKMLTMKEEMLEKVAKFKEDGTKETFDTLKKNLEEIHAKGNASTEFMREIATSMIQNRPAADRVGVDVCVGEPLMIEEKTVTKKKAKRKKK